MIYTSSIDENGKKTTINIRVPMELVERLRDKFPKYGDKSEFIRDAIEKELRQLDQDVSLCKTCTLSDRCDMKTSTGRLSCLFYYPPMKRQTCLDCERWSETQSTCELVDSWNLDMPIVPPNYCWLSPFKPRILRVSDKRAIDVKMDALGKIILKKNFVKSLEVMEVEEPRGGVIGDVLVNGETLDLNGVSFDELQKASMKPVVKDEEKG